VRGELPERRLGVGPLEVKLDLVGDGFERLVGLEGGEALADGGDQQGAVHVLALSDELGDDAPDPLEVLLREVLVVGFVHQLRQVVLEHLDRLEVGHERLHVALLVLVDVQENLPVLFKFRIFVMVVNGICDQPLNNGKILPQFLQLGKHLLGRHLEVFGGLPH